MNERIRELELQCFVYSDEMKTMRFDREKFAELLIDECIAQCYPDSAENIELHFSE